MQALTSAKRAILLTILIKLATTLSTPIRNEEVY
jgi:hypothetical protein